MIAALIAAAALSAPDIAAADADKRFADLQLIYAQSCEVRAYATFDRMCESLKRQVREAEKAHRKAARAKPAVKAAAKAESEPALALAAETASPARD